MELERLQETARIAKTETEESAETVERKFDFSKSKLFHREGIKKVDVPGLPGSFVQLKTSVPYRIKAGCNQFVIQRSKITQAGKGQQVADVVSQYDTFGLFLYMVEHTVVSFNIQDPDTGKTYTGNGNVGHTVATFKQLRDDDFVDWLMDEIKQAVGWSTEENEKEATFPELPSRTDSSD